MINVSQNFENLMNFSYPMSELLTIIYYCYILIGIFYSCNNNTALLMNVYFNDQRARNLNKKTWFIICFVTGFVMVPGWALFYVYNEYRPTVVKIIEVYQIKQQMQKDSCKIEV